jgi:hypothetical protein
MIEWIDTLYFQKQKMIAKGLTIVFDAILMIWFRKAFWMVAVVSDGRSGMVLSIPETENMLLLLVL